MGFEEVEEVGVGKVKQIVGSTLSDSKEDGSALVTNFVLGKSTAEHAKMYEEDGLTGVHAITLGPAPLTLSRAAAIEALLTYPGGSMVAFLFFGSDEVEVVVVVVVVVGMVIVEEDGSALITNFVLDKLEVEHAKMYEEDGLTGGHAITLGADPLTLSRAAAIEALLTYPGGSMVAFLFL
ncbi:PREDICTED: uncharacterized protein LOC103328052 [Prunus mume]|uniref:Uncharacterized protein LOC103328052 n=1 Tax=Prunus mume TaxID=102107 RepID=A0ABM0NRB9_PRUMU|nr:PREDICTED: uncharacterized protein LOC103328052 [Prunus mume]